jgi:hypothetical protein
MLLRRSTWIALIVLVGFVAYMLYLRQDRKAVQAEAQTFPTADMHPIFTAADGMPNRIKIVSSKGELVEVALNMQNKWDIILPFAGAASQGDVEAAATQISALRIYNELQGVQLGDLGLDQPAFIITLGFTGGRDHFLEVGNKTPSQNGYYVQLDGSRLLIVEASGIESLLNLVVFPPYKETPTPSPLPPTPTVAPTQATLAPVESVTPNP